MADTDWRIFDGETVQNKTVTKGSSGSSEAKDLPWANVPLFKPAVTILTCAVIAVGVKALVAPPKEQSAELALGQTHAQFEQITIWPGLFVTGNLPIGEKTSALPVFANYSVTTATTQLPLPKPARKPSRSGPMATVAALDAHFNRLDYDLANLRKPGNNVPRVYLDKLPEDIAEEKSVTLRKRVFIKSILPVVLQVNEDILAARQKLQNLRHLLDSGMPLTNGQRNWLYQMAERYETDPYNWNAFMARVDIVPPSLAIAQAAEESGWGTSRFAREGNALFGQYTFSTSNGMLPEERANGQRHLIRVYANLIEGVRSYVHNLNYHRAYKEFRAARKSLRKNNDLIDGHTLAGKLIRYSERGAAYIKTLRRIMQDNKLLLLDHARLHEDRWTWKNIARGERQS